MHCQKMKRNEMGGLVKSNLSHVTEDWIYQAALMSGLSTGHTVDLSCLHLLHGDPTAQNWTDITSQVSLYVTHVYAIFYITHFSW